MNQTHCKLLATNAVVHVREATGVPRRHDRRARGLDVRELAVQKLIGHFRLD